MLHIYYKDGSSRQFETHKNALKVIRSADMSTISGFDNEKLAYFAGLQVQGIDTKEAEALITSNLTLFEHRYKKGEIKDDQLDAKQIKQLKARIK